MKLDAHGTYDLKLRGEIIILRFFGAWNTEGVKTFFESYKFFILEKKLKRFGVLADFRKFEGGTPNAMKYVEKIPQWNAEHGQIARAQILSHTLTDYIVNQPSYGSEFFSINNFEDEGSALVWLEEQGLSIK